MNSCGSCNVCCTVLSVKDMTEAGKKCVNSCKEGCSIYEDRPSACKHFKCAYLTNDWDESFRPDKSGIMIAGFEKEISVYRLKEDINIDLFNLVYNTSGKQGKKVLGYDCRRI